MFYFKLQPTPQLVNNAKSQEGEGQVMQEMVVLLKRESEELKKLLQSQSNDYETKLAALQSKMKQKTEGEEQMRYNYCMLRVCSKFSCFLLSSVW